MMNLEVPGLKLVTGTPGAGKTLLTVTLVKAWSERSGRPVYYSGIADVALPWTEIDPERWFECPANSIIVIDECQRVFRPRSWSGSVPAYVSELETHRHKGLDLVLVTQHPMLMDANVRRLVGRHLHVARRFGQRRASVFEYESCKDQPLSKVDSATARHEWWYPKASYGLYKSAEVHTAKGRVPARYYVVIGAVVCVVGAIGFAAYRWQQRLTGGGEAVAAVPGPGVGSASGSVSQGGRVGARRGHEREVMTAGEYVSAHRARVPGLAYTAPVYDEVTKPVRAPMPVATIMMGDECRAYSQQGTRLDMPGRLCRQIVERGFFVAWADVDEEKRLAVAARSADQGVAVAPAPAAVVEPEGPKAVSIADPGPPLSPITIQGMQGGGVEDRFAR